MEVRPRISRLSPPASLCDCVLSISHSEAQSHFSQFNVYFAAAIYAQTHSRLYVKRHTHTNTPTKHGPSLKAAHKMPPVRQTGIQNGRQLAGVCVCVCTGWGEHSARVFCVDWDAGSVPVTDPYRRQIKTALFSWGERQSEGREAVRLHHDSPVAPSWRLTRELIGFNQDWCCIHVGSPWRRGTPSEMLT